MSLRLFFFLLACLAPYLLPCPVAAESTQPLQSLDRIAHTGQLRVCIWPEYYSITYRNPRTGALSGLDIELADALAKELRAQVQFVDSNFAQLPEMLRTSRCDLAMHAIGITRERQAAMLFSLPYLRSDVYAITTRDHAHVRTWDDLDQPGRVIAVQAGTYMEPLMQRSLKQARMLRVAPPMTRENEVLSGRADAFITDYPYSRYLLERTEWAVLITPERVFHRTDYAIALPLGETALQQRIDRFLEVVKRDGRLSQLARKYHLEPIALVEHE